MLCQSCNEEFLPEDLADGLCIDCWDNAPDSAWYTRQPHKGMVTGDKLKPPMHPEASRRQKTRRQEHPDMVREWDRRHRERAKEQR